jgi:hypothetical protein
MTTHTGGDLTETKDDGFSIISRGGINAEKYEIRGHGRFHGGKEVNKLKGLMANNNRFFGNE